MKTGKLLISGGLLLLLCHGAQAQEASQVHPMISSKYLLKIGVFFPDKDLLLTSTGRNAGLDDELNFEDVFNLTETDEESLFNFTWRFGQKWAFEAEYFDTNSVNGVVLEEDLEWEDYVFKKGAFARGGLSLDVTRIVFNRKFIDTDKDLLALGAGVHWLDLGAFVEGQVETNSSQSLFVHESSSFSGPLPNLGVAWTHGFNRRWALVSRIDWLSVSFDRYSGRFWNASVGVNLALSEHIGISAQYMYFDIDLTIRDDDWHGKADLVYEGPLISLTGTW